jgi:hypothetical protein
MVHEGAEKNQRGYTNLVLPILAANAALNAFNSLGNVLLPRAWSMKV